MGTKIGAKHTQAEVVEPTQSNNNNSGVPISQQRTFPNKPIALNAAEHASMEQRATAFIKQGELEEAEKLYKELIKAGTNNRIIYGNLAGICGMQGRFKEVIEILKSALLQFPDFPEAHYNLGLAFQELGDPKSAIDCYIKALVIKPDYTVCHNNLGNALKAQGKLNDAIASYHRALELTPVYPEAYYNLGIALKEQDNLTDAISAYNKALEQLPSFAEAHLNLGVALEDQGDITTAIECFERALECKPNFMEAHFNLSTAMLLKGDYHNGLPRYEYRFQCKEAMGKLNATPSCRPWTGGEIKQGCQLLLVGEQGLGDTLQFMRYSIVLRERGVTVTICAEQKLHSLIKASGIDHSPLTPEQGSQISEGQWIPLLSVPRLLDITPSCPLITEPYIKTTDQLIDKWEKLLSAEQRPVIGINWQGNPNPEKINSKGRSLPLDSFTPIVTNTNVTLLSLQKGFGSEQLETCSFRDRFVSHQDQINDTWDFLETAAIIANCDLIITSDTAVAHQAAGMGKTTWLLLKKVPEWRWGLEGDTTFWYPSMRLFRQRERGNWDEVMGRVAKALRERFSGAAEIN